MFYRSKDDVDPDVGVVYVPADGPSLPSLEDLLSRALSPQGPRPTAKQWTRLFPLAEEQLRERTVAERRRRLRRRTRSLIAAATALTVVGLATTATGRMTCFDLLPPGGDGGCELLDTETVGSNNGLRDDEKTDLVHVTEDGVDTWVAQGRGSYEVVRSRLEEDQHSYLSGTWLRTDASGDGEPDLVHITTFGLDAWLAEGSGGHSVIRTHLRNPTSVSDDDTWLAADVTSDGRDDLIQVRADGLTTWISHGSDGGFEPVPRRGPSSRDTDGQ